MASAKLANKPEFEFFAAATNMIKAEFDQQNAEWTGSPFEWILHLPSGSKGALGKRLVLQWCALKGLAVDKSPDSEADMTVNGHRVEVKFSTLWKNHTYTFQQIREQDYEYAVCLGISSAEVHCWVVSKTVLRKHVIGHTGQHTGAAGQETAWFTVNPDKPPAWLDGCGGTLEEAYVLLKRLSRKR